LYQAKATKDGFQVVAHEHPLSSGNEIGRFVGEAYRQRTYRFVAERMNIGRYAAGIGKDLAPNAQNLPEVLSNLQSDHARFAEFNSVVRQIFPAVDHVSVRHASAQEVEIYISQEPKAEHLAIPLMRSGTGIAQVLAILYVILTSAEPRTIIIDEPNSFLHPGAARKLMEILKDFPIHQFIIATHSPEVIKSVMPDQLMMIEWTNVGSKITSLVGHDVESMTGMLREIGARISDVIAAENIIWVEGRSEEECFPIVLRTQKGRKLSGTQFVALHDTGGFEKKHLGSGSITRLYEKLSQGGSLVPRAIGFSLDREGRSEAEMKEIQAKHSNIYFLPRRMFENFLLCPDAIANVLNSHLATEHHVTVDAVKKWIESYGSENKYFNPLQTEKEIFSAKWIAAVHAGKLLDDLFQDVSKARVQFVKTRDDPMLLQWLLNNSSENCEELANYLERVIREAGASVVDVLKSP